METQIVNVQTAEAYERGEKDISFFAALCLPEVCTEALPNFYIAIWQLLINRDEATMNALLRFALGLPRGHAKTTFIKILVCWLIVYDRVNFVLIVCSNGDLADIMLADIHDILSSDNITAIYGAWEAGLAIDSADTKKALYHGRPVVLVARGWSAGIRGLNLKHHRPDVIICDDVQTRKNDESVTERATLLKELAGTIFKAIAPRGRRYIIYIGNMYSEDCILNKFKNNSHWISMITGAILANGQPLWPALISLKELMESYEHDEQLGLAHIWFAEVMNDPQAKSLSLLPHPLPDCPHLNIVDPDGAYMTVDPAGFRKTSDDNVAMVHYKFDNVSYVVDHTRGIMDPQEFVKRIISLAVLHGVSLIGVEDVGYQQTLGFWITFFLNEAKITNITVVALSPHGRSKETRIRLYVQSLYNKSTYILSPEARRDFTWQASLYKLGVKDNRDDFLDCAAYSEDIRNEYWGIIRNNKRCITLRPDEMRVVGNNTCF